MTDQAELKEILEPVLNKMFKEQLRRSREAVGGACRVQAIEPVLHAWVGADSGGLTEGHAGALAGEDEDEGGDELSERRLEGARVVHLLVAPQGDPIDRHFHGPLASSRALVTTAIGAGVELS